MKDENKKALMGLLGIVAGAVAVGIASSKSGNGNTVYLAVRKDDPDALKYNFKCKKCGKQINLRTGGGRYGNLGAFECPMCGREYYATIDDNPRMHVFIWNRDDMPSGLLDNNKHNPLFELTRN